MTEISYSDLFQGLWPEIILVLTALVVVANDRWQAGKVTLRERWLDGVMLGAIGCALAIYYLATSEVAIRWSEGMLVADSLTAIVKVVLLALTLCTLAVSTEARFTTQVGEYLALVLLATVSLMFMVGSENLLLIFLALESASLTLYVLSAMNRRDVFSIEAALRYFLFGGVAAGFTLFGLSLLYGLTGDLEFSAVASGLGQASSFKALLMTGLVMTLIGFGFKIGAAPMHLWVPDIYRWAPLPTTVLISSGSKMAGFFLLAKFTWMVGGEIRGSGEWGGFAAGWTAVLSVMAALSMVLGNLMAMVQNNLRRLLAYSAIGHAGYMLLGVLIPGNHSLMALVYYAATYGLATAGAFAVTSLVREQAGGEDLVHLDGLYLRSPFLAHALAVFVLSLAGIPPLAGFFGKFYLFAAVSGADVHGSFPGYLWLVILGLGTSCIALYYYLQVLKRVYVEQPENSETWRWSPPLLAGVLAMALGVLLFGCLPGLLLDPLQAAMESMEIASWGRVIE